MKEPTEEMWQRGLASGYTPEELKKGYIIESSREKAKGASYIRRIEELGKFKTDEEAAEYAEQHDGIERLSSIGFNEGDPDYACYIDTPENREKVIDILEAEAVGTINVFMESRRETHNYLKDMTDTLNCLHIFVPYEKAMEISKDDLLTLIHFRVNDLRADMGLRKGGIPAYHYEETKEEFRLGQQVHNFNGSDYKIMEIYNPNCVLLQNIRTGQFAVGNGIKAYYRYPKGQEPNSHNTDYGVEWGYGTYLSSIPSEIDFQALREEFGKEPPVNENGEYELEIREVLSRTEKVKADNLGDAIDELMERYKNEEIVLGADDMKDMDIVPVKPDKRYSR